jgi:F-type H+-transporting ATPase subunit delta
VSNQTVARNYAEVLFDIAGRSGQPERYAELIDAVAAAVQTIPRVQAVLMSPRIPKSEKARFLGAALKDTPRDFVLWLQALVKRGRQGILREVASEYLALVDEKMNRVRASVTLARQPDDKLRKTIEENLGRQLDKQVIATYLVEPDILGGAIIRVGDRVLDGSVRRRMTKLRRQLLK